MKYNVYPHAIERYAEHSPTASAEEVCAAIDAGTPISVEMVWSITQRRSRPDKRDSFVLSADKRGVFVLAGDNTRVVTYLRLAREASALLAGGDPIVKHSEFIEHPQAATRLMKLYGLPRVPTIRFDSSGAQNIESVIDRIVGTQNPSRIAGNSVIDFGGGVRTQMFKGCRVVVSVEGTWNETISCD